MRPYSVTTSRCVSQCGHQLLSQFASSSSTRPPHSTHWLNVRPTGPVASFDDARERFRVAGFFGMKVSLVVRTKVTKPREAARCELVHVAAFVGIKKTGR